MGSVKIIFAGYRDWAIPPVVEGAEFVHVKNPKELDALAFSSYDAAFFCGWSWYVKGWDALPCYCFHPSSLPNYRGGSPIQHQIIEGELSSRATVFRMTKEMDAGPIVMQVYLSLDGSLAQIFDTMSVHAHTLFTLIAARLVAGEEVWEYPQTGCATIYDRRKPSESEITLEELRASTSKQIADKVRALKHPDYPNAYITCGDGEKYFL